MEDKGNRNIIIAIIVVVLLCCCCTIFASTGWFYWGDPLAKLIGF
jgi:hypothetical protein